MNVLVLQQSPWQPERGFKAVCARLIGGVQPLNFPKSRTVSLRRKVVQLKEVGISLRFLCAGKGRSGVEDALSNCIDALMN